MEVLTGMMLYHDILTGFFNIESVHFFVDGVTVCVSLHTLAHGQVIQFKYIFFLLFIENKVVSCQAKVYPFILPTSKNGDNIVNSLILIRHSDVLN